MVCLLPSVDQDTVISSGSIDGNITANSIPKSESGGVSLARQGKRHFSDSSSALNTHLSSLSCPLCSISRFTMTDTQAPSPISTLDLERVLSAGIGEDGESIITIPKSGQLSTTTGKSGKITIIGNVAGMQQSQPFAITINGTPYAFVGLRWKSPLSLLE
jgi:hypothetical protein